MVTLFCVLCVHFIVFFGGTLFLSSPAGTAPANKLLEKVRSLPLENSGGISSREKPGTGLKTSSLFAFGLERLVLGWRW